MLDGDRLVAYADLAFPEFGYTSVLPEERGRGIGTALADWLEALARSRGAALVSTQVPDGGPADRLLTARGYERRWTAWDLELPEGADIAAQPLPDGHAIRDAREDEHEAVFTRDRGRVRRVARPRARLEDFAALVWGRPGHQPWNLRVVTGPADEILGATHVYLPTAPGTSPAIATRKDQRGRGLAAAMLADSFALARAARCRPLLPLHRLAHRRARPLREGRHAGHLGVGQPGAARPLTEPAQPGSSTVVAHGRSPTAAAAWRRSRTARAGPPGRAGRGRGRRSCRSAR